MFKIGFNTTGLIFSFLLVIYGLLKEGYITPAQLHMFSQQYQALLIILLPMIALLGYHLSNAFKPKQVNNNEQFEDLINAAYAGRKSIEIEQQTRRLK